MIETQRVEGDELPFRVTIDGRLQGAADVPARAVLRALCVGNIVPRTNDYKEAARHLLWNYDYTAEWRWLIHVLDTEPKDWPAFPMP